jgi:hypothetical protein
MTNVIKFERATMKNNSQEEFDDMPAAVEPRPAFSFDMTQPDRKGLVLIDACVPLALAVEFMNLVTAFAEPALA